MGKPNFEIMAKGFLRTIAEWGDIQAEKAKIRSSIMANEFKSKRNFIWKMAEQNAERQNKLKFIQDYIKQNQGQDSGIIPGQGTGAPEMRLGAGGEPGLHYESPIEKKSKIELGRKYVKSKQLRYEQTGEERFKPTTGELAFLEKYPDEIWEKTKVDKNKITPSQALNVISDPFKSQQLKRYYPELYKKIETIAKQVEIQDINIENAQEKLPTEQKSPYPEYPDAFLENGIWKVMQNGKKYKIKE